jgi:hypothetical protein
MNKNLLINGEFNIAQRGTSFDSTTTPKNDDDTYLLDRWILLSGANDVADVSQTTDAPQGSVYAQKAVVQTVNEKFGFLQIIENANCQNIIDDVASLSFQAKTGSNAIRNIRAAILSWSGAKDVVTSDVVSSWSAEGTDPTLVTNWTYENIPFDIPLTSNYQKFAIPDVSIDTANAKNVAVFIWVDDTNAAVSDELFLGQVQLEKGSAVSDYEHRKIGKELMLCQRYYERLDASNTELVGVGYVQATNLAHIAYYMKVEKRVTPTVTITGTASNFRIGHQATGTNASQVPTTALQGATTFDLVVVTSGSLTVGHGCRLTISGDPVVEANSEL